MLLGVALLGISTPSVFAFAIEETVAPSVKIYPQHYDRIANLASSLRNMMYGSGQCLGTLFGAILRKEIGFRHGLEIVSVFYVLLGGYGVLQLIGC